MNPEYFNLIAIGMTIIALCAFCLTIAWVAFRDDDDPPSGDCPGQTYLAFPPIDRNDRGFYEIRRTA